MADQIKTVTDKSQFRLLIDKFYSGKEIYIKTKSGNLNLQFLGYNDDKVAFRIPRVQNLPETISIYSRRDTVTINMKVKFIERKEDTFIFEPNMFQILSMARREDRKVVSDDSSSKNVVFVENILSDFIMKNELSLNEKKIDQIKEVIIFDLAKQFQNVVVYFVNEARQDVRIKHFMTDITPIFIPDFKKKPDEKNAQGYNYFMNEIYSKDHKLAGKKDFISEITVPVVIRNMFPFGYIQVNNTTPMTDAHLAVVKRTAVLTNELFKKNNFFIPENDKVLISDLSRHGLGIVFRERRVARYFKQNGFVSFEIKLPTGKKVIVGAIVRNVIFQESGIIKAGFEITVLDAMSEVFYEEYLDMLKEIEAKKVDAAEKEKTAEPGIEDKGDKGDNDSEEWL